MRSTWTGAVSFGLVSITVKVYPATEERDIRFHQIHAKDGGRIRYRRTCLVCGEEVSFEDIAKGYDLGGGETVVLTDEDFAELPLSTSHAIEVLEFVPAEQIDPILYARAYYLEPEGRATKPYVLLRDALTTTDRVAIVKVALRQREQLATLRVHDDVLLLNTMVWPDEVRRPDFAFRGKHIETQPAELAMAESLIESMAADFDATQYTDNYRAALREVIDAKVAGREVIQPEEQEPRPSAAVDLMAALRASVERARAARGEEGGEPAEPKGTRSARGTAAKTAARKTAGTPAQPGKKATPARKTRATKAEQPRPQPVPKKTATPAAKKQPAKTAAKRTPAKRGPARTLA
jgi:DNA end-binding protein Ku